MIVIFDIDDCLMPWAERVHLACVEAGLAKADQLWTQWNMYNDYGCTREEWLAVVDKLVVPDGIYHQPPYPGVLEAIDDLWQSGHEIHLVTARGFFAHSDQIKQWTYDWIETNHIPGKLWFSQNKGETAQYLGATHAIDDAVHNVTSLLEHGVDAYLMTQPHNAKEDYPVNRRVSSVPEFVERIMSE